jgi:hypothetical protein
MSILVGFFAAQKLIRFQFPIYFTSELDYFHWQLFPPESAEIICQKYERNELATLWILFLFQLNSKVQNIYFPTLMLNKTLSCYSLIE